MPEHTTDYSMLPGVARRSPAVRWLDRWGRIVLAVYWIGWLGGSHSIQRHLAGVELGFFQLEKIALGMGMALLTALLVAVRPLGPSVSPSAHRLVAVVAALLHIALDQGLRPLLLDADHSLSRVTAQLIGVLGVYVVLAHAGPPLRRWPVLTARLTLAMLVPALTYLALAPRANLIAAEVYRSLSLPPIETARALHLFLAAGLTWLLASAAVAGHARPRLSAAVAVSLMLLMGPVLEQVQELTGRGAQIEDVAAHMIGVLAALLGWSMVRLIRETIAPVLHHSSSPTLTPPVTPPPAASSAPHAEGDAMTAPAQGGQAERPDTEQGPRHRFVGNALRVAALTLMSRLTGLVRDAALAAVFGLGPVADAFFIGFLVPNLFRRLFGEGALASAFIPHYTDLLRRDGELARRFASLCLVLLSLVLAAITVVAEIVLAIVSRGEWSESTALALRLTMVMLPYMPLVCAAALIGGVLHVHGRFAAPAAAPVVLNVFVVAAALLAAFGPRPAESVQATAFWIAAAVLLAALVQLLWQLAAMARLTRPTMRFDGAGPTLRSMLLMMGPMVAALAVFQINALLDSLIAFTLSPHNDALTFSVAGATLPYPIEVGSVAALQWAQRLYQFPLGVFGIALATAIFPALAHAAAAGVQEKENSPPTTDEAQLAADDEFSRILRHGLRLTLFIALPAAVGLILVRSPLTALIYQRGAFAADDAQRVATILAGYAASVWAYSLTHVLTRAFYAHRNASTPLRVSMVMVSLNLALNLVLIWPMGAAGLAWSTATTGALQAATLLVLVRRCAARPIDRELAMSWLRTAALTAVMAAVLAPMLAWMRPETWTTSSAAAALGVTVSTGMIIVAGGAWISGAPELRWLLRRRVG